MNPKLFLHSEFKTQIANLKFENETKQRAGLDSIRKMIDLEEIQIDLGTRLFFKKTAVYSIYRGSTLHWNIYFVLSYIRP